MPETILAIPFYPVLGDTSRNAHSIISLIQKAPQCDAIVFPECALTGYLLESLSSSVALPAHHELLEEFVQLSKDRDIGLGFLLWEDGAVYNAFAWYSEGQLRHIHRKVYPPTYGMFDEARYWRPGDSVVSFQSRLGHTGILICEDAWHTVPPYALHLQGAGVVIVPSASPARGFLPGGKLMSSQAWHQRLSVLTSTYNQQYVYLNRSGAEDGVYYNGESFAVNATGEQSGEQLENGTLYRLREEDRRAAWAAGGPFQNSDPARDRLILERAWSKANAKF